MLLRNTSHSVIEVTADNAEYVTPFNYSFQFFLSFPSVGHEGYFYSSFTTVTNVGWSLRFVSSTTLAHSGRRKMGHIQCRGGLKLRKTHQSKHY